MPTKLSREKVPTISTPEEQERKTSRQKHQGLCKWTPLDNNSNNNDTDINNSNGHVDNDSNNNNDNSHNNDINS